MAPKAEKETLVLLINIGVTRRNSQSNPGLLEKAKHVAQRIIEKKIFLSPKDEIAVILMGSSITKNSLNTEHVGEFLDFQVPNWNLIDKIMHLKGSNYCSNWIEALEATVEYIKQKDVDITKRKIVLMSDFNEEDDIISQFEADTIAENLSTENIQFITIGEESLDERPESSLTLSEAFLKDLHKKINGQHLTFDNAILDLRYYVKEVDSASWYATLELSDIKIPIVSYIKVTDTDKFSSWKITKDGRELKWKTEYRDRQRTSYAPDEIITGYKYGGTFIPIDKRDEEAMSYKSGPKSYTIHSFTHRNNIDLKYWYDDTTRVVLASNQDAAKPFYSLVQAMHNKSLVAIVRKVYAKNRAPRMVALFPCINIPDELSCLVEICIPFAEDRRVMEIRPLKSVIKQLSSEQNEEVDNLLDSLMLPDTDEDFYPGEVPDPSMQHRWHMLSHRALNPDKPLPPMEDYLQELLEAPAVKEKSKCNLQRITELFQLENIDPKAKQKEESNQKDDTTNGNEMDIQEKINTDNKVTVERYSPNEPYLSLDTSDVDLDELATKI
ncbi:X-ray repair cross-complementing protein 5 [Calliopsis andreniformis]|uniref:X-ray repair cross-complementing protein 5 n=1 Tax=Calliopsis andreniformis TaxID=337506 RepID=UPI003FCD7A18